MAYQISDAETEARSQAFARGVADAEAGRPRLVLGGYLQSSYDSGYESVAFFEASREKVAATEAQYEIDRWRYKLEYEAEYSLTAWQEAVAELPAYLSFLIEETAPLGAALPPVVMEEPRPAPVRFRG